MPLKAMLQPASRPRKYLHKESDTESVQEGMAGMSVVGVRLMDAQMMNAPDDQAQPTVPR